jgi:hypothetical protein
MRQSAPNATSYRLLALTAVVVIVAILLFWRYRQNPDTATLAILAHGLSSPAGTDSTLYMHMGESAFHSGDHLIYSHLFFTQHEKFIYPPCSLFLLDALNLAARAGVPVGTSLLAILLVSWGGTLVAGVWLYREVRICISLLEACCIAVIGALFLPIAEALYRGQVQLLLTFLWGVSVLLWARKRPGASAFILALTCAFKPQLAVFLLWGSFRRQWRFTMVFAATLLVIAIASVAHFGLRNNLDYISVLSYLSRHGEALWANQSINGLLNRVLRNGDSMSWNPRVYPSYRAVVYLGTLVSSALILIMALVLPWRKRWQAATADFLFFGCACALASPIVWEHHYGYFYFLLVFLLARLKDSRGAAFAALAACILAMANRYPPLDHRIQGITSILGAYLLWAGFASLILLALDQQRKRVTETAPRVPCPKTAVT